MKIWQIIIISGLGFFLSYIQAFAQCYIDASDENKGSERICRKNLTMPFLTEQVLYYLWEGFMNQGSKKMEV